MGYSLDGIGLARPSLRHQRIARNIVINYYNDTYFADYEAFQEGLANILDPNSLVPDVVFMQNNKIEVVIEIANHLQFKSKLLKGKVEELLSTYDIKEVFVYNYEESIWSCYGKELDVDEPSYSNLLELDLDDLIEL